MKQASPGRVDQILEDQNDKWALGQRRLVEDYLSSSTTEGSVGGESLLDCIYNEVCLREEAGERCELIEYQRRFPNLAVELSRLFEVHMLLTPTKVGASSANGDADAGAGMDPAAGWRFGRFRLDHQVGQGSFGVVWAAFDPLLERRVAIKIPRKGSRVDLSTCLFEARAAARLQHPNIVPVYEVAGDDVPYIVSGYIDGRTLAEAYTAADLSDVDIAAICRDVLHALEYAHQASVIHRDIKPSNIILDQTGRPFITDFGLAVVGDNGSDKAFAGTPAYMSPEQVSLITSGDARSDVYSLGVVLYEGLAGKRPFCGPLPQLIDRVVRGDAPRPRTVRRQISRDLEAVCLKAMHKQADARYQTAGEMADDLDRVCSGQAVRARALPRVRSALRYTRRKAIGTAVVGGLCAVSGLGAWSWSSALPAISQKRRVRITTNPAGAHIAMFPLNCDTGIPELSAIVQTTQVSPVTVDILPGDYLVVAWSGKDTFHEVFRHVPASAETVARKHKHLHWSAGSGGVIELPEIVLFGPSAIANMGRIPLATVDVTVGLSNVKKEHYRVPEFFLDRSEVTFAEYKKNHFGRLPEQVEREMANWGITEDESACYVSYDQAVEHAEDVGKRLPDEAEFERTALFSNIAWSRIPSTCSFSTPADAINDIVLTDGPIFALCSGLAEWTSTWAALSNTQRAAAQSEFYPPSDRRIVRGGNSSTIKGDPSVTQLCRDHTIRTPQWRHVWQRGLGFRCARSAQPRLTANDFVSVVTGGR